MKNLVIQHWNGQLPIWGKLAEQSMRKYCSEIGAEYLLLTGYPMGIDMGPWAQKVFLIDKKFDEYDNVLMLDMDMVYTNIKDNIFDYEGIGRLHKVGMLGVNRSATGRDCPKMYKEGEPIFFGNCIKLNRSERIELRSYYNKDQILSLKGTILWDESIVHYLFHKSGVLKNKSILEVPHDRFCDLPEEAHKNATLIHFCGTRKTKIESYLRTR